MAKAGAALRVSEVGGDCKLSASSAVQLLHSHCIWTAISAIGKRTNNKLRARKLSEHFVRLSWLEALVYIYIFAHRIVLDILGRSFVS